MKEVALSALVVVVYMAVLGVVGRPDRPVIISLLFPSLYGYRYRNKEVMMMTTATMMMMMTRPPYLSRS